MAEGYSVGNLRIAFRALDKTSEDFKKLEANLRVISSLISNISTADLGKFTANVKIMTRAFSPFIQQIDDAKDGISRLNETLSHINGYGVSSVEQSIEGIKNTTEEATGSATELSNAIENGQANAQQAIRTSTKETNQLATATKNAGKEAEKSANGGFSKLANRIGRIVLYRTIRRGLQMITQTFTNSIQAYAQVDDNINKTMSQLTSSTKIIQLSLGTMIFPILQAITPVVQRLAQGFANMANAINKSMALAQGNATYTKINTDALKDYRKELNKTSGALFDFDKFRVLNNKNDSASESSYLIEETVSELTEEEKKYSSIYYMIDSIGGLLRSVLETIEEIGNSAAFQTVMDVVGYTVGGLADASSWLLEILNTSGLLEPVLGGIAGYLTYIGVSKLFIALSGGKLWAWIKAVVDLLKYDASGTIKMLAGDFAKFMSTTKMLAISFGALTASIIYLIQNWKDMSETGRALTLTLSLIAAAVVGVFTALVAVKWAGLGIGAAIKAGLSAAALTAAIGIAIGSAASTAKSATADIPKYAVGGMPDKGTMFVAGEAGAEMVYNMPSGQSGVANVQQIAQAVYQGTYQATMDWWKSARNEIGGDVYLDGEKIYQSVGRTASKHGKRFADVR